MLSSTLLTVTLLSLFPNWLLSGCVLLHVRTLFSPDDFEVHGGGTCSTCLPALAHLEQDPPLDLLVYVPSVLTGMQRIVLATLVPSHAMLQLQLPMTVLF